MKNQPSRSDETRNPQWWTNEHTSAWDRVKEAFHRDWEQTKADFSSTSGQELNQDVTDTVAQAVGTKPLPPPNVANPIDPIDAAKNALKARDKLVEADAKAAEKIGKAQNRMVEEQAELRSKVTDAYGDVVTQKAKADEKVAELRKEAAQGIQKQQEKINEAIADRNEATEKWRQAEREASYGYAAHMQDPNAQWDDRLETTLRNEWNGFGGSPWEESRMGIRRGWDYARNNK